MKIYLIEDKREDIQGILDYCEENNHKTEVGIFENAIDKLESFDPDLIILDLQNNTDKFDGCTTLSQIWQYHFRPTCIFSGQIVESLVDEEEYPSPLVRFIPKGDEQPVIQFIETIAPFADSISSMRRETNSAMRKSLDFLKLAIEERIYDCKVLSSLFGNRIKAYFDEQVHEADMPIWSQYIYPALSNLVSTGDILVKKTDDLSNPENYRIVLSQSCDLQQKYIKNVLVAKCFSIERVIYDKSNGTSRRRAKDELVRILNTGYINKWVPFPGIKGVMPDLAVNLKKLELIELTVIESEYSIAASLSSPYKERFVWAYMQNACRPGVPDLGVEQWIAQLDLLDCDSANAENKVAEKGMAACME